MIADDELRQLEAEVDRALERGDDAGLHVLGYGEISMVLAWPAGEPRFACKRLPVFDDAGRVHRYREVLQDYLEALGERGVRVVESELRGVERPDGRIAAYVVQPAVDASTLVPRLLEDADPDPDHPAVQAVLDAIEAVVDERVGLDAQLSNWTLDGAGLRYFDVTTPLLRDADGNPRIDLGVFLASFPAALRGALRRFVAPGVIARYHDLRTVMLDVASNLLKERLDPWLPSVVEAVNRRVDPPVDEREIRKDYASDARQWELLLKLRRADRWWQRRVRRRPYPFLLPRPIER
jgi:hypothetical protein